jgi:hypothetical protein
MSELESFIKAMKEFEMLALAGGQIDFSKHCQFAQKAAQQHLKELTEGKE